MTVAWGARLTGETNGLDVIGIRALDQNIEASLANGITTISPRARYTSILAWSIGFYLTYESEAGPVLYDEAAHAVFDNRVRFLVAAATAVDTPASRRGVLGLEVFVKDLKALAAGGTVHMPTTGSFAVYNTYFQPSAAIGLVEVRSQRTGIDFGLTARGSQIYEARRKALEGSHLLDLLRHGGELDYETAVAAIPAFSLRRTGDIAEELALLREAVTVPWVPANAIAGQRVAASYQRMADTRAWLDRELSAEPAQANELIARNYAAAVNNSVAGIELDWASFEWHRRVHFTLELLLTAISKTLQVKGSMSIAEVVAHWAATDAPEEALAAHWNAPTAEAAALVAPGRFGNALLRPAHFNGLEPHIKAIRAFELLVTLDRDRAAMGLEPGGPNRSGAAVRTIEKLAASNMTMAEVMLAICDDCVVQQHVFNTMRKMGNNQECSLRFYPDGPVLVPTETTAGAGFSGSRLKNTMGFLVDLGLLSIGANGAAVAGVAS